MRRDAVHHEVQSVSTKIFHHSAIGHKQRVGLRVLDDPIDTVGGQKLNPRIEMVGPLIAFNLFSVDINTHRRFYVRKLRDHVVQ